MNPFGLTARLESIESQLQEVAAVLGKLAVTVTEAKQVSTLKKKKKVAMRAMMPKEVFQSMETLGEKEVMNISDLNFTIGKIKTSVADYQSRHKEEGKKYRVVQNGRIKMIVRTK